MRRYSVLILLLACPSALAQTDYPTLLGAHPTGVQRGQTTDILVYTWRSSLAGAYTLLFDSDAKDFQTTILSDGKQGPLSVRLTVAANARTGIRQFRVATPQGVSSVASLVVGDEPGVLEVEPNDTPDKAQAVTLPVTLYGRLHRAEKIAWYKFRVQAGDVVCFEVLSKTIACKTSPSWYDSRSLNFGNDSRTLCHFNFLITSFSPAVPRSFSTGAGHLRSRLAARSSIGHRQRCLDAVRRHERIGVRFGHLAQQLEAEAIIGGRNGRLVHWPLLPCQGHCFRPVRLRLGPFTSLYCEGHTNAPGTQSQDHHRS